MDEGWSGAEAGRLHPLFAEATEAVLIDVVASDGTLLWMNDEQMKRVGRPPAEVVGHPLDSLYDAESASRIRDALSARDDDDYGISAELQLFGRAGQSIRTLARLRRIRLGAHRVLLIVKMDLGPIASRIAYLEDEVSYLRDVVNTASEGFWCIEFLDPVDTNQSRDEIIRQIFENQSYWRLMSDAMANLYHIPEDIDIRSQSVRLYWPRSEANERFAGQIIDSGYNINKAISIDHRHDGKAMYVENDVRGLIVDGFLLRIWGNARDVSERFAVETAHAARMASMHAVFDVIPDPLLIIDDQNEVVGFNEAFSKSFPAHNAAASFLASRLVEWGSGRTRRSISLTTLKGQREAFDVRVSKVPVANAGNWTALMLRARPASRRRLDR